MQLTYHKFYIKLQLLNSNLATYIATISLGKRSLWTEGSRSSPMVQIVSLRLLGAIGDRWSGIDPLGTIEVPSVPRDIFTERDFKYIGFASIQIQHKNWMSF